MGNKKTFRKLWIFTLLFLWLEVSYTFATQLNIFWLDFASLAGKSITRIYYWDNWNDFWWAWMLTSLEDLEDGWFEVKAWTDIYLCEQLVRWRYYNTERWERLWPLDEKTWNWAWWEIDWLTTEGGIYTSCRRESLWGVDYDTAMWMSICWEWEADGCIKICSDEEITDCAYCDEWEDVNDCKSRYIDEQYKVSDSFYWMLTHKYKEKEFTLIAWVNYDETARPRVKIKSGSNLWETLVSIDNSNPVWFVYDYNWWIWFSSCKANSESIRWIIAKLNNWSWMNEMFELSWNTIIYTWTDLHGITCWDDALWLRWSVLWLVVEWLVWRSRDDLWAQSANDPKMQYFSSVNVNNATLINFTKQKAENLCRWKWQTSRTPIQDITCIDAWLLSDPIEAAWFEGKTLIVKNGNVIVKPVLDKNSTWYYDIFINWGNLLIEENPDAKYVFTNDGHLSETSLESFASLVWTAYASGLNYTWKDVSVASLLRWNFIVWWKVLSVEEWGLNNKYFIYWKFTSKDGYSGLRDVFLRTCEDNRSSDDTYCPYCLWENCPETSQNYYTDAPLIVIDHNYDSPLFW